MELRPLLNKAQLEQLETFIDGASLINVAAALVMLAEQKASHIRENWQDEARAKSWERDAKKIEKICLGLEN